MASKDWGWRWVEGEVDPRSEHITISRGADPTTLVRLAPGGPRTIVVQFLFGAEGEPSERVRKELREELDFYLLELNEEDPWSYARYHCGRTANALSAVRWSHHGGSGSG